jgi:hypothetical protein
MLPSQEIKPLRVYQNYILDYKLLRLDSVKDKGSFKTKPVVLVSTLIAKPFCRVTLKIIRI